MPLEGKPLIGHLCEALRHARSLHDFVLATSVESSDDPLEAYALANDIPCFRGSLENVAERMLAAATSRGADVFIRLTGDSPLLDPSIVDQAVQLFVPAHDDMVTNVQTRSFPRGQSAELITAAAMARAVAAMSTAYEREHVTPHFYANPQSFRIRSFAADTPRPDVQLSVDTVEDFARAAAILRALGRPAWQAGWKACVNEYDRITSGAIVG